MMLSRKFLSQEIASREYKEAYYRHQMHHDSCAHAVLELAWDFDVEEKQRELDAG